MSQESLIYLCHNPDSAGGGVKTYVDSLLKYRIPGVSSQVLVPNQQEDQSRFKLLHVNEHWMLNELRGECPTVYSLHNHDPYCPSGTKYLAAQATCCDRAISPLGCTWGRFINQCGSRRPFKIFREIQSSYQYLGFLKTLKIPIIANSDYVRNQLIYNGLSAEQIVTLHYGIAAPLAISSPLTLEIYQAQRILFIGRIVPDKGLDWLLKALVKVSPTIRLDIAGEGWAKPSLEKLAEQLGVSDRVTWHGWCSSEKLDALYQQSLALIFPSVWPEPAGLVTLEAYARYRPVIASRVGGIPEHIRDQETGLLVEANDIAQLSAAIEYLAENYSLARHMGELSHTYFLERFTLAHHVQKLQSIYEQVVSKFQASKDSSKTSNTFKPENNTTSIYSNLGGD